MLWTLTSYLDHRAKYVPTNPKVLVFSSAFFGFGAGAQLVFELEEGNRSPMGIALGCLMVVLWLAMSLESSYFVLRAVRHHQDTSGSSRSS